MTKQLWMNTISGFDTITFISPTGLKTDKISVVNASGKLKFDKGFSNIDVSTSLNENLTIETSENSTINIPNNSGNDHKRRRKIC